jgi:thiol:disulfide interchange protein DsbA
MKFKLLIPVLLACLFSNVSAASIDEGIEYKAVSPAQPTITKNKVEVIEFFWYGCPHCYHFEPYLKSWLAKKPANVTFIRIPAVFNPSWAIAARAFYTAETLGILEKKNADKETFHTAYFNEIHKKKKNLDSKAEIQAFFARFGVSAEDFNNTFNSFAVNTRVGRAEALSRRYQIDGVPSLIVNGKYRTDGPMANGNEGMLKILDFLIEKETKK